MQMAFQIKPYKKETENKTIRFPIQLIEDIENAIKNKDVTFSRFVIQAWYDDCRCKKDVA